VGDANEKELNDSDVSYHHWPNSQASLSFDSCFHFLSFDLGLKQESST
jgi:hypothetical protein